MFIGKWLNKSLSILPYVYYRIKSPKYFMYNEEIYEYDTSFWYNRTWQTERAVEIPIFKKILCNYQNKKILEVGNVLSHYMKVKHIIVDKFEKYHWVINEDIIKYKSYTKFDLIISISTLEHIERPDLAIDNMKSMLNKNGWIICSYPIGCNKILENIKMDRWYFKRVGMGYNWIQVESNQLNGVVYNHPYPCANGLVIGLVR